METCPSLAWGSTEGSIRYDSRLHAYSVKFWIKQSLTKSPQIREQSPQPGLTRFKPLPLTRQSLLILQYLVRDGTVSTETMKISSLSVPIWWLSCLSASAGHGSMLRKGASTSQGPMHGQRLLLCLFKLY